MPDNSQLIDDEYQRDLHRAPTEAERASDLDNVNRYGWNTGAYGGVQAQIAKRAVNTPGSGNDGLATVLGNRAAAPGGPSIATQASPMAMMRSAAMSSPAGRYPEGPALTVSQPSGGFDIYALMALANSMKSMRAPAPYAEA